MNNNDIEILFDKEEQKLESNSGNVSAVVTEQAVPQNVPITEKTSEVIVKREQFNYDEYRQALNQLYSTSTQENSLILTFIVDNLKCKSTLSMKSADLQENIIKSGEFPYSMELAEKLLVPVIVDYNKYNKVFSSNIEILDGDRANFIARTSNNDSVIIMGIDMTLANRLKDIVTIKAEQGQKDSVSDVSNQKGISNYLVIILTMLTIGLTLVGTIFFTIMSNK